MHSTRDETLELLGALSCKAKQDLIMFIRASVKPGTGEDEYFGALLEINVADPKKRNARL